jgi:hypothetical protein
MYFRTTSDKRALRDMSLLEDSTINSTRLTPTKFSTSHAYGIVHNHIAFLLCCLIFLSQSKYLCTGCFSIGSLIHVHPSYPADGERAKVDILRIDNLLSHDPITRDLRLYPGPLIK